MSTGVIILIMFVVLLVLAGVGVLLYFLLRPKKDNLKGTDNPKGKVDPKKDPSNDPNGLAQFKILQFPPQEVQKFYITDSNNKEGASGYLSTNNNNLIWVKGSLPTSPTTNPNATWNYGKFKDVDNCIYNDAGYAITVTQGQSSQGDFTYTIGAQTTPVSTSQISQPVGQQASQLWRYMKPSDFTNPAQGTYLWQIRNCNLRVPTYITVENDQVSSNVDFTKGIPLYNLDATSFQEEMIRLIPRPTCL